MSIHVAGSLLQPFRSEPSEASWDVKEAHKLCNVCCDMCLKSRVLQKDDSGLTDRRLHPRNLSTLGNMRQEAHYLYCEENDGAPMEYFLHHATQADLELSALYKCHLCTLGSFATWIPYIEPSLSEGSSESDTKSQGQPLHSANEEIGLEDEQLGRERSESCNESNNLSGKIKSSNDRSAESRARAVKHLKAIIRARSVASGARFENGLISHGMN
jgi:hypothetical protein